MCGHCCYSQKLVHHELYHSCRKLVRFSLWGGLGLHGRVIMRRLELAGNRSNGPEIVDVPQIITNSLWARSANCVKTCNIWISPKLLLMLCKPSKTVLFDVEGTAQTSSIISFGVCGCGIGRTLSTVNFLLCRGPSTWSICRSIRVPIAPQGSFSDRRTLVPFSRITWEMKGPRSWASNSSCLLK